MEFSTYLHYVKYAILRVFSNPYFPLSGQNLRFLLYGNMQIRESPYFGIFYAVLEYNLPPKNFLESEKFRIKNFEPSCLKYVCILFV